MEIAIHSSASLRGFQGNFCIFIGCDWSFFGDLFLCLFVAAPISGLDSSEQGPNWGCLSVPHRLSWSCHCLWSRLSKSACSLTLFSVHSRLLSLSACGFGILFSWPLVIQASLFWRLRHAHLFFFMPAAWQRLAPFHASLALASSSADWGSWKLGRENFSLLSA